MTPGCQLCRAAAGLASDGFVALFNDRAPDEVVARAGELIVALDVAPVVPGHALILPRAHERSFLRLWTDDADSVHRVVDVMLDTLRKQELGGGIICEHGLGAESITETGCVEHAHLHVIPGSQCLKDAFVRAGVALRRVTDLPAALHADPAKQYIYLRDADGAQYVATHHRFPSQLVRRLVAHQHAEIFWSWRDYIAFADVIGTQERIAKGKRLYTSVSAMPACVLMGGP